MNRSLLDLRPTEAHATLIEWGAARGLPSYRAEQIVRRLWLKPVRSWSEATELPGSLRAALESEWPVPRLAIDSTQESRDGTKKYLWRLADGEAIESVLIPTGSRRTLCLSSQAGCALGCGFCATGRMGFRRNLGPAEIAGQVREIVLANPADKPTNVVFMGMGEPLLNWPAVDVALSILNEPLGFGIGARHITVSTVGIIPGMEALRARPEQFRLAISLHATDPKSRIALMPIEKKYALADVLAEAKRFGRRVTFEYVMIQGRNDTDLDAERLIRMAGALDAHVNLLPLHPGGAGDLMPSSGNRIRAFAERLRAGGIEAVVRRSRGLDINAACGQLFVAMEAKRRSAALTDR
jgi:23S rRNA (adenine2503-C2)-methyltransferase